MKPLTIKNIKVVEVDNFNTVKGFFLDKKSFERKAVIYISKADMIFARMPSNTSNSVIRVAKKLGKPYLVEVGGCAWDSYWNHGIMGKMIAPLMYYREKKYVATANFAIYVTKNFLQRRYPNSNTSTNCSNVYLQPIDDSIIEKRIAKINSTDLKKVVLGQAVNSIDVKYKGEHLIIQAMGALKKRGIRIDYQIVGPGIGDYLISQAKKYNVVDQLHLIGTLRKEEIFEWYKNIDIYVQPSKQEGLPRSVIEAMSVGCPALGSNIAGIPELIDQDCLFNPNNISQIVFAIENLLTKENMIRKAKSNFERSKEYNLEEIEKRRQVIFSKFLESVK
ncbi:glycosyltransferase [uncultured Ruminococcus sp.]|uniref:glycosyltransferase n=1 Tax=uncultured Ruminococcus sp. TaxID=165186 RepID=UPI00265DEADE|nr:glycosyltransferase [uncultured Ruminococcus sp.]